MSGQNGNGERHLALASVPADTDPGPRVYLAPEPGTELDGGRYTALGQLGSGGMAVVFQARQVSLDRLVAIKMLHLQRIRDQQDPALAERFQREALALGRIYSPHLVRGVDHFTDATGFYIVMEYIEGETLAAFIRRNGQLSLKEAARILTAVAGAVDAIHHAKLVHRDVKAENVILRKDIYGVLQPILLDLGIARVTDASVGLGATFTRTNELVGTSLYMSPEQSQGGAAVDGRTDVWSLGVLAYHCLSGRFPFFGGDHVETIFKVRFDLPTPLTEHRPDLDGPISQVIARALAKKPNDRYDSAGAFAAAFAQSVATVPARAQLRTAEMFAPTLAGPGLVDTPRLSTPRLVRPSTTSQMMRPKASAALPLLGILGAMAAIALLVGVAGIVLLRNRSAAQRTPPTAVVAPATTVLAVPNTRVTPVTLPAPAVVHATVEDTCDELFKNRVLNTPERRRSCQRFCNSPGANPFLVNAYKGRRLCR